MDALRLKICKKDFLTNFHNDKVLDFKIFSNCEIREDSK